MFKQILNDTTQQFPNLWRIWTPEFASLIIVTLIIVIGTITYWVKIRNLKPNQAPGGYVLVVEMFVKLVRNLIDDSFGKKYRWMTPYLIYIFLYIGVGVMLSLVGLSPQVTSLTVAFALGFVTWIVTFVFALKYQKWHYFHKFFLWLPKKWTKGKMIPYLPNPLDAMTVFPPLISISMRLWGNITAGGVILSMVVYVTNKIPYLEYFNFVGGIIAVPLHIYFDVLDGLIQTMVFGLLTIVYWSNEMQAGLEIQHHKKAEKHMEPVMVEKQTQVALK